MISTAAETELPEFGSGGDGANGGANRGANGAGHDGATLAGLVVMLTGLMLKSGLSISMLPGWEFDPFNSYAPATGLGPAGAMTCDMAMIVGAAMLMVLHRARVTLPVGVAAACAGVGSLTLAAHGFGAGAMLHDVRLGTAWLGAWAVGLGVWVVCADVRWRALVVCTLMMGMVMLLCKAAAQMLIENPRTLETFRADKEAILAAQGWTLDSPSARGYERRISQSEPTGWIGFGNIVATLGAAGCAGFGGLAGMLWRRERTRIAVWTCGIMSLACATLTIVDASKGGIAVLGVGAICAAALVWIARRREAGIESGVLDRLTTKTLVILLPAGCAAVLAAVVIRGMIGERMNELSVLFRWYYLVGAGRIFAGNWLTGVGPDGFKEAYLTAKPPISPEEVQLPHCWPADWIATLGLGGVAWCAGVVVLMVTVGRAAASRLAAGKVIDSTRASPVGEGTDDNALPKLLSRGVLIAPVLVTILAMQAEQAALTPDAAVVRIGSLVLSVFVGLALMPVLVRMSPRVFVPGAVGAAVAVACHSMIELTGTNHQSAGWVMAVLAIGAGLMARGRVIRPMWGRVSAGAAVVVLAVWIAMGGVWTSRVWRWEALVEAAAQRASGPAMVRQYVELAKRSPAEADGYLREASVIASAALGANVPARADVLMSVTRQMIVKAAPEVITLIDQAAGVVQDVGTWRETRRVRLVMGALIWPAPPNGPGRREEARGLFTAAAALPEGNAGKASVLESRRGASVASWRVTALRTVRAVVANEPADEVTRPLLTSVDRELTDVLAEACRLDPYNLQFAFQRFKHAAGTNVRGPALAEIARRVIEVNDLQRLDAEVRGLTKQQLAEVMAAR